MLATAVIAGHGVALCPVEVFRREIERGDLLVLFRRRDGRKPRLLCHIEQLGEKAGAPLYRLVHDGVQIGRVDPASAAHRRVDAETMGANGSR